MFKLLTLIAVLSIFTFSTIAFAHGPGGWGPGHMMGQGYGPGHMMGPGYGGHMGGPGGYGYGYGNAEKKFLDETADIRREMHQKQFEYAEARRNPETDPGTVRKLEREIQQLQSKMHEKSPRGQRGYAPCWE